MELFYVNPEGLNGQIAVLDDFERRHMVQTLRKKTGDLVNLTDGNGHHLIGTISQTTPQLVVQIKQKIRMPMPAEQITLACGFIKQNRLDFILEKGTELGVTHFVFFKSRYANYHSANQNRLLKVVRQALKQSLRFYLPRVTILKSFAEFLEFARPFQLKLAAIDQTFPTIKQVVKNSRSNDEWLIAIGPEGGFSKDEVAAMLDLNFQGISLGSHRLRTETAALSALAFVQQYIQ